uniref:Uncharacterized protein n=1 Tax=Podarcis muralis TaxID=64176 RepID=A0A670J9B6_PODMU
MLTLETFRSFHSPELLRLVCRVLFCFWTFSNLSFLAHNSFSPYDCCTPLHESGRGPSARPFLRRTPVGTPKACSVRFKSPVPSSPTACQPASDKDALQHEIVGLKCKDLALYQEIVQTTAEGYTNAVGQGDGVIQGLTTKELYPEFELDVNSAV